MTKRSTGYLTHLFNLIGQHSSQEGSDWTIKHSDQIANQIQFLETLVKQYISLLQIVFPEFEPLPSRDRMMPPTQVREVLANENLENMRFVKGLLKHCVPYKT